MNRKMSEKNNYIEIFLKEKIIELKNVIEENCIVYYRSCLKDLLKKVLDLYDNMLCKIDVSKRSGAELLTHLPYNFDVEDYGIYVYLEDKSDEEQELMCYYTRLIWTYILFYFFCDLVDLKCSEDNFFRLIQQYECFRNDFINRLKFLSDIDKKLSNEEINELISSFIILVNSIITSKKIDGSYENKAYNFYQFLGIEVVHKAYKKILYSLAKTNDKRFVLYYQRTKQIIPHELYYLVSF